MNKTVTINISGIIFHIEEDAFERLNKYLNTIRSYFSSSDGRDEIMADIESRIAELLQEKISVSKQVVTSADVEHVIGIMGKPEDYAGEQTHENREETETSERVYGSQKRRLFRDPDNKVLGGVCGGVSAYFDIDVVWVRVILVALTFLGFSGVLVYLIMWIVVPEARTTAEKLQMRGETVDINNISKTIKEEAEQLKNRAGEMGSRATKAGQRARSSANDFISTVGSVLVRLIGFFLICIGISLLIGYVATAFGLSFAGNHDTSFKEFTDGVIESQGLISLLKFSVFLAAGIPIIMLLYAGVKLLFNIKYSNKWINISAAVLWLTGVVLCVYVGLKCYESFDKYDESKNHEFVYQLKSDTLFIGMDLNQKYNNPTFLLDDLNKTHKVNVNDGTILRDGERKVFINNTTVHIIPNHTDSLEVLVVRSAHGANEQEARTNSENIVYSYRVKDSAILLNNFFTIGMKEKWRKQEVNVYIKIPKDKVVYLDPTIKDIIYDVENTTDTYDEKMVGRRWRMTSIGLTCIDCDGLDKKDKVDEALEDTKQSLKEMKEEIKQEMREEKEKLKEELQKIKH